MTNEEKPRPTRRLAFAGVAAAALAAGLAGIYVIGGEDGNTQQAGVCAASAEIADAVAPHAQGEVAAFLPAKERRFFADLAFLDDTGTETTLGALPPKVRLVNLWATWCAPCRKEMPALDQLQAELGGEDFEVTTISVDQGGTEKPKGFLDEIGVSHLAFRQDPTMKIFHDVRARGRAPGLPSTLLLDRNGCEIGALMGPAEWASDDAKALIRAALEAAGRQTGETGG
jgi:thiol-disulfide isomerase/thioredoxin